METTASIKAYFKLALLALLALVFSILFVFGLAPVRAYADGDFSVASVDTPAVSDETPSDLPSDSTTASSVGAASVDDLSSDSAPVADGGNLSAADNPYPGDTNPNQHVFIGMAPSPLIEEEYTRDENNVVHVYIDTTVGHGVDIGGRVEYVRISSDYNRPSAGVFTAGTYDARVTDANIPVGSDLNEAGRLVVNVYKGSVPFAQGAYFSDMMQYQEYAGEYGYASSSTNQGNLQNSSGTEHYDINPLCFLWNGSPANGTLSNRIAKFWPHVPIRDSDSDPYVIHLSTTCPYEADMLAVNYPKLLLFNEVGTYVYSLQATFCEEYVTQVTDEHGSPYRDAFGNTYEYVTFAIYASNPVIIHINVAEAPTANLVISAKDDAGNNVALDDQFHVQLYKDLGDEEFALCSETDSYATATAGTYKLKVVNRYGNFVKFEKIFTVDEDDITTANSSGSSVVEEITLTAILNPPVYTIRFENWDGTLLSEAQYNEGTLADAVMVPANLSKPADGEHTYYFEDWDVSGEDGEIVWTRVREVTSDQTYRAHFIEFPRYVVSNSTIRIYASGGVFGRPKPDYVESYELSVSQPDADEQAKIRQAYAGHIGVNAVDGIFNVDIIQHNLNDDSPVILTEDVGEMTLTFPVAMANATLVNVYQLHEVANGGGTIVIEHNNLKVVDGSVEVPIDGRMSTFIVTVAETASEKATDPEGSANDSPDTGTNSNASSDGEKPAADAVSERVSPAVEAAGGQTAVAVGESATDGESLSVTRAAAIDMVKTGEDPDAAETRDASAMEMLAFGVTLAFMVMIACAIRRRETE